MSMVGYLRLIFLPKYHSLSIPSLSDDPIGQLQSIMTRLASDPFLGLVLRGDIATGQLTKGIA